MHIDLDNLLKNTQMRKPENLVDTENFLKQTPHLPFFLQPLSPAEKTCYQHKALTFIPTPKQPIRKGFKWDRDMSGTQDGFWDKDGKFCVKPKKDTLWVLEGSLVPYTTAEMESMKEGGELKGQRIKRVDDTLFVSFEEIVQNGGILSDEKMDEIYKLMEAKKSKNSEEMTNTRCTTKKAVNVLLAMGCPLQLEEIERRIKNKTRLDAIVYLQEVTKKSKFECVDLLNIICSECKIVFVNAEVDDGGFKPVKNIVRKK